MSKTVKIVSGGVDWQERELYGDCSPPPVDRVDSFPRMYSNCPVIADAAIH